MGDSQRLCENEVVSIRSWSWFRSPVHKCTVQWVKVGWGHLLGQMAWKICVVGKIQTYVSIDDVFDDAGKSYFENSVPLLTSFDQQYIKT